MCPFASGLAHLALFPRLVCVAAHESHRNVTSHAVATQRHVWLGLFLNSPHMSKLYSFLRLNNIPLYVRATFCLSIHLVTREALGWLLALAHFNALSRGMEETPSSAGGGTGSRRQHFTCASSADAFSSRGASLFKWSALSPKAPGQRKVFSTRGMFKYDGHFISK